MAIATQTDVMMVAPGEMISEGLTDAAERNSWPLVSGAAIKTLLREVVTRGPKVVVVQLSNALIEQTMSLIESLRVLRPGIRIVAAATHHHEIIEQVSRCAGVTMYLPHAADVSRLEEAIYSLATTPAIEPGITDSERSTATSRRSSRLQTGISRLGMAGMIFMAFMLSLMVGTNNKANAAAIVLSDKASKAYFNLDGTAMTPGDYQPSVAAPIGLYDLQRSQYILGQPVSPPLHDVNQQWFWYRVGNGPERQVNDTNLTRVSTFAYDTNPSVDTANDRLEITYQENGPNPRFQIMIQYDLIGGPQYSHTVGVSRTISVISLTGSNLNFHIFDYSDLTLGYAYNNAEENNVHPDLGQFLNSDGSTVRQWDNDGDFNPALDPPNGNYESYARRDSDSQTTTLTDPDHFAISKNTGAGNILSSLNNGSATTLSDNMTTNGGLPANLAFAFQYDFILGPGQGWIGGANLLIVPEPSSFAVMAGTTIALALIRPSRKRYRQQHFAAA